MTTTVTLSPQEAKQSEPFEVNRFLRMAQNDPELKSEIEKETAMTFRELKPKARNLNLSTNTTQMLKILFNVYVGNYDNYRNKYAKA